jgi:hypothetical protein
MMYGMNAPREEMSHSGCRNRGRSVSMVGGGGAKATKSVTINEEESEE